MEIRINSKDIDDTIKLGENISKFLFSGSVVTLVGDLGAGKTILTKGIAKGLNVKEIVNSPTFNILKCYFSGLLPFYHIDAYRLEDSKDENKNIGLDEVIEGDGVCVIEWPKYISELISVPTLNIEIKINKDDSRIFILSSNSQKYIDLLTNLERLYKNV